MYMDLSGNRKQTNTVKKPTGKINAAENDENKVVNHQININIALPSSGGIKKLWQKAKRLVSSWFTNFVQFLQRRTYFKKLLNIALVSIVIVSSFFLVKALVFNDDAKNNPSTVQGVVSKKKEKPDFNTYYPDEAKVKEMSYDVTKKVASYPDKIDTTTVTVSQQKLPDSFRANPVVELEKLAKQINANTKLETATINAFMGQSVKGPQTVVLVKNETLIFIKSDEQVAISDWNKYLDSLALQN